MDQQKTLPFLSLSNDEQLLILEKLENTEIIRFSLTCSHANNLIDRHKKVLSSRPQYGEPLYLKADEGFIDLEFRYRRFKAWDDFQERIRGLSFSSLEISIVDHSTIPQLVDMLKNWKQSFPVVYLPENIAYSAILEVTDALSVSKWIALPRCLDTNTLTQLQGARNRGKFRIDLSRVFYENHFDVIRNFGDVRMKATPKSIVKFLWDLHKAQCAGNLKKVLLRFSFMPPEENIKTPFLLHSQGLPPIETVLPVFPVSLYKLSLNNNMCALIKEQSEKNMKKTVLVMFINDDSEEIIDYMLKTLEVSRDFFTESQRQQYLAMNNQEKVLCLKKACEDSRANALSS